jgi:hypothetical protein
MRPLGLQERAHPLASDSRSVKHRQVLPGTREVAAVKIDAGLRAALAS